MLVQDHSPERRYEDDLERNYQGQLQPPQGGPVALSCIGRPRELENQSDRADESDGDGELAEAAAGELSECDAGAERGRRWMNQIGSLQQHEQPEHNRGTP